MEWPGYGPKAGDTITMMTQSMMISSLVDKGYNVYPHVINAPKNKQGQTEMSVNGLIWKKLQDVYDYEMVFTYCDDDSPIIGYDGYVFRQGIVKEISNALPWCAMPFSQLPCMPPRPYPDPEEVRVGYCGSVIKNSRNIVHPAYTVRADAIIALHKSNLKCTINLNPAFFKWEKYQKKIKGKDELRDNYFDIMQISDLSLCARGCSNYSNRLTEVIASGRLPMHIGSKDALPFDGVCWDEQEQWLWIDYKDIDNMETITKCYIESLSKTEWKNLHRQAREIHDEYFTYEGFVKHIDELFD